MLTEILINSNFCAINRQFYKQNAIARILLKFIETKITNIL